MMRPKLRARMPSITSRVMLKTQSRLVRMTSSQLLAGHAVQHGVARDAGVVDEHVDRARGRWVTARHALLAGVVVADVELVDGDAGLGLELLRGGVVAGVVGGDAIALVLQRDGDRVADPARTSGHDGNSCHVDFLPRIGHCC